MKTYDLLLLGPATRDENIDYTGAVDRSVGGAVTFCAPAARAFDESVFAAVKIAPEDADIMDAIRLPEADKCLLPSRKTTLMRNEYFTPDREKRNARCDAQSDPILPDELPDIRWKLAHLAGLLRGDFPASLIDALEARGRIAADAQGFLRCNEGGPMVFRDLPDKLSLLPRLSVLKADAAEAQILTGLNDRAAAARQLHNWGVPEMLISHSSEMLAYDGKQLLTCPVRARNLSGRTGRGDTTFAAYLAMRRRGADVREALLYATACVSLKMETPGPFAGAREDVERYIRTFYKAERSV